MTQERRARGIAGEDVAAAWYASQGYECGYLGAPTTNRVCVFVNGRYESYQNFQGGQLSANFC